MNANEFQFKVRCPYTYLSAYRRQHATPVLKAFRKWLDARTEAKTGILPKSVLGEAIIYASRNFKALTRYTMRGYLNIGTCPGKDALN